jgi:glucose/arabinose dehydrogenase
MRSIRNAVALIALFACSGILLAQQGQTQQDQAPQQPPPPAKKEAAPTPSNRLTIEVTAGDANKPIENASVYVKTLEQHLIKDKKFEVQVKTNQNGTAHVPDAPLGRVEIQIVAEGWKPFGHWYDITDPRQVIKIHLERPPKWY